MATRPPFWKWHFWKSLGFFLYTQVMCQWGINSVFKAKLKLESGNWKIQFVCQAVLKVTSLKINRLPPIATNNMLMKLFVIDIAMQTWVTLRRADQQGESSMMKILNYVNANYMTNLWRSFLSHRNVCFNMIHENYWAPNFNMLNNWYPVKCNQGFLCQVPGESYNTGGNMFAVDT